MRELILDVLVPMWAAGVAVTLVAIPHAWRRWRESLREGYEGLDDEASADAFVGEILAVEDEPPRPTVRREVPQAQPAPRIAELRFTRVELFTRGVEVDVAPHPIFDQLDREWSRLRDACADAVRCDWDVRELTGELVSA